MIPIQLERRANGVANEDLNVGSIVTALTIVNRPLWQRGRCLQEWAPAGEDGCNQRMIRLWSPPLRSPISTAWPSARHKESNFAASICFMTAPFAWPLFNSCIQVTLRATSPLSLCSYNSYWAAFCFKLLIGHLTHRLTSNLSILDDRYWNACSKVVMIWLKKTGVREAFDSEIRIGIFRVVPSQSCWPPPWPGWPTFCSFSSSFSAVWVKLREEIFSDWERGWTWFEWAAASVTR